MRWTKQCLCLLAGVAIMAGALYGWAVFCERLSGGEWWGLGLALSPVFITPLGIAIYADIAAGKIQK